MTATVSSAGAEDDGGHDRDAGAAPAAPGGPRRWRAAAVTSSALTESSPKLRLP